MESQQKRPKGDQEYQILALDVRSKTDAWEKAKISFSHEDIIFVWVRTEHQFQELKNR